MNVLALEGCYLPLEGPRSFTHTLRVFMFLTVALVLSLLVCLFVFYRCL